MQPSSALLHEKGFSAATEWFIPGIKCGRQQHYGSFQLQLPGPYSVYGRPRHGACMTRELEARPQDPYQCYQLKFSNQKTINEFDPIRRQEIINRGKS